TATIVGRINGQACPTGFTLGTAGCYWTQTASGVASLAWTGLAGNEYELTCANLQQNTNGATNKFYLQFGEGAGPAWQSASYAWSFDGWDSLNNIQRNGAESDTGIILNAGGSAFNVANYGLSGTWRLHGLQQAVNKQVDGIGNLA